MAERVFEDRMWRVGKRAGEKSSAQLWLWVGRRVAVPLSQFWIQGLEGFQLEGTAARQCIHWGVKTKP